MICVEFKHKPSFKYYTKHLLGKKCCIFHCQHEHHVTTRAPHNTSTTLPRYHTSTTFPYTIGCYGGGAAVSTATCRALYNTTCNTWVPFYAANGSTFFFDGACSGRAHRAPRVCQCTRLCWGLLIS